MGGVARAAAWFAAYGAPLACLALAAGGRLFASAGAAPQLAMLGAIVWMAAWWVGEVVPLAATALVPLVAFPLLGIASSRTIAKSYFNDTLMLFLGSFVVALAVQKHGLHRRVALNTLALTGSSPRGVLLGCILAPFVLSMWISNTATCAMMVPMALTMARQLCGSAVGGRGGKAGAGAGARDEGRVNEVPEAVGGGGDEEIGDGGAGGAAAANGAQARPGAGGSSPDSSIENGSARPARGGYRSLELEQEGERHGLRTAGGLSSGPLEEPPQRRGPEWAAAQERFAKGMVLGVAYAANIGGMATLIGTAPNGMLVGVLQTFTGKELSFANWLAFAVPLCCALVLFLWLFFCYHFTSRAHPPDLEVSQLRSQLRGLGPMSWEERTISGVFLVMVFLWLTRHGPLGGWADWFGGLPSDAVASMGAAVLLFFLPASPPAWWPSGGPVAACLRAVRGKSAPPPRSARYDVGSGQGGLPAEPIVNWEDMKELPWAVVLLMGGGFALSDGIKESGMLESLSGGVVALSHWPHWLLPLASAGVVTVVTEVASNTATASIFLPVLVKLDLPYNLMLIPATLACSLAFMLPNATPPNAIVYSTGIIEVKDMLLPGLMLNIAGVVLVALWSLTAGHVLF